MPARQIDPPPRLLMGPGPVNGDPRVLRAMSAALLGQYDPAMTALMTETQGLYRDVFATANDATVLVDGTSRAGIEAALVSLIVPGDRVLVARFGRFGHLLVEIAERCGAEVSVVDAPWGRDRAGRADRRGRAAGAAEARRRGARRHLHDDRAAARGARRDLPRRRRPALRRRDRHARRQPVRDGRLGHRRRHRRAAEVPRRPLRQRADHPVAAGGRGDRLARGASRRGSAGRRIRRRRRRTASARTTSTSA